MVQGLKYGDRTDLAPWMARWMARAGRRAAGRRRRVIVPVPLHWRRFLRRASTSRRNWRAPSPKQSGKKFAPDSVKRVKATRQQVGLGARARGQCARRVQAVPPEHEIAVSGRRVLLIDDVYTTGATVAAVTKALKKGGARRRRRAHLRPRPAGGLPAGRGETI
jgi:predicted amidophosphoribosyltransferase